MENTETTALVAEPVRAIEETLSEEHKVIDHSSAEEREEFSDQANVAESAPQESFDDTRGKHHDSPLDALKRHVTFLAVPKDSLDRAAQNGHTSKKYVKAVEEIASSSEHPLHKFYKTQSYQSLGEERDRVAVPIWIAGYKNCKKDSAYSNVDSSWFQPIEQAIKDINFAVPGLYLYIEGKGSKAKVKIAGSKKEESYTNGYNILTSDISKIYLYSKEPEKKRTSCHEILHALGVGHEHQRKDRDNSVKVKNDDNDSSYEKRENLLGITQFDPFSIMLYPEDEKMLRNSDDPVWFTKSTTELNREMSQLDKVGLNNLYRPCKHESYEPKVGRSDLYYCGRDFGPYIDCPFHDDGKCGPDSGPNCPACRVLETDRMSALWNQTKPKWQGWTGKLYCGDYCGVVMPNHNGYCGPNNGPSCYSCYHGLDKRS